jgi:hypothetical protein
VYDVNEDERKGERILRRFVSVLLLQRWFLIGHFAHVSADAH